jgi:hypothetical protein
VRQGVDKFGNFPSEAPVTAPVVKDMSGNLWENKPDVAVKRYLENVAALTDGEYSWIEGVLAERKWPALWGFLNKKKETTENDDDRVRFEKASEIVEKVLKGGTA